MFMKHTDMIIYAGPYILWKPSDITKLMSIIYESKYTLFFNEPDITHLWVSYGVNASYYT